MDKINIIEKNKPYDSSTFKAKDRGICSTGVYTIETNDKVYVGSSKCINKRINKHINMLKNNIHPYNELQHTFNNNNKLDIIIEYVENREKAFSIEQCIVNGHHEKEILNKARDDVKRPALNRSPSEYNIQRIKETHTGKIVSDETKLKLSKALTGKIVTEETKEKLRQHNLGKKTSDETRQKLSVASKGKVHTEETKKKISEAKKGKGFPEKALAASLEQNRVPVVCNDVHYKSFAEAAKALNTSDVTVRNRVLNNNFPNYQYASSDSP